MFTMTGADTDALYTADRAGRQAIRDTFDSGGFKASTHGKTYPDFYGDAWKSGNCPIPIRTGC